MDDGYNENGIDKTSFSEDTFEIQQEDIEEIETDHGERKLNKDSLEKRRKIETLLAERRLKESMDYLWDKDFVKDPDGQA